MYHIDSIESTAHASIPVDQMWLISSWFSLNMTHFTSLWHQGMETTHGKHNILYPFKCLCNTKSQKFFPATTPRLHKSIHCQTLSWTRILISLMNKPWVNQKVTPQQIHIRHFWVTHATLKCRQLRISAKQQPFPHSHWQESNTWLCQHNYILVQHWKFQLCYHTWTVQW
jgi:hypothetical protein